MTETYGFFIEELAETKEEVEYLVIGFCPASVPLQKRWKTNGLSADFIADYLQTFFIGKESSSSAPIPVQSKNAVKYIANELLENAMKFHDSTMRFHTTITFNLCCDKLIFKVVNSSNPAGLQKLKDFITNLLQKDPYEFYIEQMEANATCEHKEGHSGLGFLSMICDYSAKIGWKFEVFHQDPLVYKVTTMVTLDI